MTQADLSVFESTRWWDDFRRQMPVAGKWSYLDHAAVSPLPSPTQQAISGWLAEATHEGDTRWSSWNRRVQDLRPLAAGLIGADPDEVALIPNTTAGVTMVAEGYPWQAGENVVVLENEFPSNAYPWLHLASRDVEVRRVPVAAGRVDLDKVRSACDGHTRVIAVSWVGYASGWRIDAAQMADLAHQHGALLFLDAIQGLGVFPLDVRETDVDFLAADGHKWLLGPEAAGLFYVRRDLLDRLRPLGLGWNSVRHAHDYDRIELDLRPSAQRYEGGSLNMSGFLGLAASLELLARFGLSARHSPLADRVLQLTDYACEQLERIGAIIISPREANHRSGIVTFQIPASDPKRLRQACLDAHIVLSCRGGGLRISPHAYNNQDDIDRMIQRMKDEVKDEG